MPSVIRDVAAGLWIWRTDHPDWAAHVDWDAGRHLGVRRIRWGGGGHRRAHPRGRCAAEVWPGSTPAPPPIAVVLKPDHVRDVDRIAERYDARAFGPSLFWRDDIPETDLEPIEPGSELPGGLVALYDGRGRNETPLWVPEQRALVFADALTERGGALRVWGTPWHEERVLPALARHARSPVRARHRVARRAGPRPGGVRARARAAAVGRVARRYSGWWSSARKP